MESLLTVSSYSNTGTEWGRITPKFVNTVYGVHLRALGAPVQGGTNHSEAVGALSANTREGLSALGKGHEVMSHCKVSCG